MHRTLLLRAAIGGIAGAGLRWLLGEALGSETLPWGLLTANVLGCALLGIVVVEGDAARRELLGLGVAGGCTSMSALALAIARRLDTGATGDAALLVVVALASGIAAFLLGERAAASFLGASDAAGPAT